MPTIKAAIFDMDGLLIDSERVALRIFQQICRQYELHDSDELHTLFLSCVGTNQAENYRRINSALKDRVNVARFLADCGEHYQAYNKKNIIPVKHGVEALLDALDRRKIPASVATSTHRHKAIEKLDNCKLTHRFRTITGGDQVIKSKPEPDIFLTAAQSINVAPEHCLAFEDSFNGVRAAVAAGMQVYQVPDLIEPDEELMALGHTVVRSLADVESTIWP